MQLINVSIVCGDQETRGRLTKSVVSGARKDKLPTKSLISIQHLSSHRAVASPPHRCAWIQTLFSVSEP